MKATTLRFSQYWIPVLGVCAAIFISSSMPEPFVEVEVRHFDKIMHLVAYAVLGYLLLRALSEYQFNLSGTSLLILAIVFSTFYGITDEIHQSFVPGRMTSISDAVFDFFGSTIGAYSYRRRIGS